MDKINYVGSCSDLDLCINLTMNILRPNIRKISSNTLFNNNINFNEEEIKDLHDAINDNIVEI